VSAVGAAPQPWTVPILVFHHVCPGLDWYTNTPPSVFARQLSWIVSRFECLTVRQAHDAWRSGTTLHDAVVLTFDDGYVDNVRWAAPLLRALDVRATFFVLPLFAGRVNSWNARVRYTARHMDWEQLGGLLEGGHEIGSHGLSHRRMDALGTEEVAREVHESAELIRDALGQDPVSFAYPFGFVDERVAAITAERYRVGLSTVKSSHRDWNTHRHDLRRVYLSRDSARAEALTFLSTEAAG
jgi:peptidoglycan/xylan/chitin deacetylase (PgdA/CDA1 family)